MHRRVLQTSWKACKSERNTFIHLYRQRLLGRGAQRGIALMHKAASDASRAPRILGFNTADQNTNAQQHSLDKLESAHERERNAFTPGFAPKVAWMRCLAKHCFRIAAIDALRVRHFGGIPGNPCQAKAVGAFRDFSNLP